MNKKKNKYKIIKKLMILKKINLMVLLSIHLFVLAGVKRMEVFVCFKKMESIQKVKKWN